MINENILSLIKYRIEQAEEALDAAEILLMKESRRASVNRSYYAMFYAVLALLCIESKETSKHSGAIALFDQIFVKPGFIPTELSRWLHQAFIKRMMADYNPINSVSMNEAKEMFEHAREFVMQVKNYLQKLVIF